jgi:hypothetical protein
MLPVNAMQGMSGQNSKPAANLPPLKDALTVRVVPDYHRQVEAGQQVHSAYQEACGRNFLLLNGSKQDQVWPHAGSA